MTNLPEPKFALVQSGGGARGAYEAGVFHYLRTQLPEPIASGRLFNIYCGTSVGAINNALLVGLADDPQVQAQRLRTLWEQLESRHIYRSNFFPLLRLSLLSALSLLYGALRLNRAFPQFDPAGDHFFQGLLDTSPFVHFLRRSVPWTRMHQNILNGTVDAMSVTATHIMTGAPVIFVERHEHTQYRSTTTRPWIGPITAKHIMASAALPIAFPIIRVNGHFFGDGSLRQNTPVSPAIHLGADRILVISLREKLPEFDAGHLAQHETGEMPRLSDILGKLMNSIFLDKMDYDLAQMQRINYLIRDMEETFGPDAMDKIGQRRSQLSIPNPDKTKVRRVLPFVISPSENIGAIATDLLGKFLSREKRLNAYHRFFAKLLEGSPDGENDLVSYLLFEREYLHTLIDMGFQDARRNHDNLVNFFSNLPLQRPK